MGNYYRVLLLSCNNKNISELKETYNYLDFENKKHKTTKREETLQKNYDLFISEIPKCPVCRGFIDGNKNQPRAHKCCENIEE